MKHNTFEAIMRMGFTMGVLLCLYGVHEAYGNDRVLTLPVKTEIKSTLSISEIRMGVKKYYSSIQRVDVSYEQLTSDNSPSSNIIPSATYHFAFSGDKRYRSQAFGGQPGIGGDELVLAYDGENSQSFSPGTNSATIQREVNRMTSRDAYLQAISIPLLDSERAGIHETNFFLPYALEESNGCEWKVLPFLEIIDGAQCHVIQSENNNKIWLDPDLGYAMRFREIRQFVTDYNANKFPLYTRHHFSEYQFSDNDVTLPHKIAIQCFSSSKSPENMWNKVTHNIIHKVISIKLNNEVKDEIFSLQYPPGTLVNDNVNNRFYRIGNNKEEIDLLEDQSLEILSKNQSNVKYYIIAVNILLLLTIVVIWWYRKSKKNDASFE